MKIDYVYHRSGFSHRGVEGGVRVGEMSFLRKKSPKPTKPPFLFIAIFSQKKKFYFLQIHKNVIFASEEITFIHSIRNVFLFQANGSVLHETFGGGKVRG